MWWLVAAAVIGQTTPAISSARAFRGPAGEIIEVVVLKPLSTPRALIRVRNVDWPHDGIVMPCEVRESGSNTKYVTRYDGGDWTVMSLTNGRADVELPTRPAFVATFDKRSTEALRPDALVDAHQAQEASGASRLFQRKSYPKIEARYEAHARAAAARLSERCKHPVSIRLDWGSFGDEVMAEVDAWKACAPIVGYLERSCGVVETVDEIVCRMGSVFGLDVQGGVLTFTTTPAGAKSGPDFLSKKR